MSDDEIDSMPATDEELERASLVEPMFELDCEHEWVRVDVCRKCDGARTVPITEQVAP